MGAWPTVGLSELRNTLFNAIGLCCVLTVVLSVRLNPGTLWSFWPPLNSVPYRLGECLTVQYGAYAKLGERR